jgi:hypothetical protein
MKYAVLLEITQRSVVIICGRFGTTCRFFKGQNLKKEGLLDLQGRTDRFSRNIFKYYHSMLHNFPSTLPATLSLYNCTVMVDIELQRQRAR